MKKSFLLVCSSLVLLFASCSKKSDPIPDPVGDLRVRYVNTVQGSAAQDLYVNDAKKSTTGLTYGSASEYFTMTSGNTVFKFYDAGTTVLKAQSDGYNIPLGINITVFNYQSKTAQTIGAFVIGDDMSSPAVNKAKVRFLNINSFGGSNTIAVTAVSTTGQTSSFINSLVYGDLQNAVYQSVDPGTKFTFASPGVTDAPTLDPGIVAGKNYTIWIDGSSATNLTGHTILQN